MECWPRHADPSQPEQMHKGWPKTVSNFENYGRKAVAWLPTLKIAGLDNAFVQVVNEGCLYHTHQRRYLFAKGIQLQR